MPAGRGARGEPIKSMRRHALHLKVDNKNEREKICRGRENDKDGAGHEGKDKDKVYTGHQRQKDCLATAINQFLQYLTTS